MWNFKETRAAIERQVGSAQRTLLMSMDSRQDQKHTTTCLYPETRRGRLVGVKLTF